MDLSPEIQLLLYCARTEIDQVSAAQMRHLLQNSLNWETLLELAYQHGVIPLLYKSLKATGPGSVPGDILDDLRIQTQANLMRNRFKIAELMTLLDLLQAHNILAIPYKGPVLAATAYGDVALRAFADLDILLRQGDIEQARELLVSQGYRQESHLKNVSPTTEYAYRFVSFDRKLMVELHWAITPGDMPCPLEFDYLYEHLEPITLADKTIRAPSAEDTLLILCAHGHRHHWLRLMWISDIAALICARPDLDWARVVEQANTFGLQRILLVGLFLASALLAAPLPEQVQLELQRDRTVALIGRWTIKRLFFRDNLLVRVFEGYLWLISRERLLDRGPYLLRLAHKMMGPDAVDRKFIPLPSFLSFLYYPLRPVRIVKDLGVNTLRALFESRSV